MVSVLAVESQSKRATIMNRIHTAATTSLPMCIAAGLCLELIDNPNQLQTVGTRMLWCLTQTISQAAVDRLHFVIEPVLPTQNHRQRTQIERVDKMKRKTSVHDCT